VVVLADGETIPAVIADEDRAGKLSYLIAKSAQSALVGRPNLDSTNEAGGPFNSKGETMPGRGPQTFKKRQKEQQRRERQQEKIAKRLARKHEQPASPSEIEDPAGPKTEPAEAESEA
jgi:hypothetical protein